MFIFSICRFIMEDEEQKTQVVSEIDQFGKIQTVEEQEFNEKYANLIEESESILDNSTDRNFCHMFHMCGLLIFREQV